MFLLMTIMTLLLTVAYERINLAVNEDTRTAVCTHRGFPKPLLTWRLQNLSDPQHFLDARDVHTTAVQDPQDHLYSLRSTVDISGGPYRSVTCLIHNPTLNVTLNTTHILNKGKLIEEYMVVQCLFSYIISCVKTWAKLTLIYMLWCHLPSCVSSLINALCQWVIQNSNTN